MELLFNILYIGEQFSCGCHTEQGCSVWCSIAHQNLTTSVVKSDIFLHRTLYSGFGQVLISVDPRGIINYNEVIVHKYPVVHTIVQKNLVTLCQTLLPSFNYVFYHDSYSFVITEKNKSWTKHAVCKR
jgi:hypothetical protein